VVRDRQDARGRSPDVVVCTAPRGAIAHELVRLAELVRVLRDRCPWDREQTHHSLVQHLLEETYEAMEAIELLGDDPAGAPAAVASHVSEELGDILCQVLFHAMLAEEEGLFTWPTWPGVSTTNSYSAIRMCSVTWRRPPLATCW